MAWLAFGVLYAVLYLVAGVFLHGVPVAAQWFRLTALLVPPLAGVVAIVRRRHDWLGCQWLFWATIALGLMMSAASVVGWTLDEALLHRSTSWLGWHTVFALFGAAAPLLALLAQPHRGSREDASASSAVDIAGVAVVIGFLYSYFVTAQISPAGASSPSLSLIALSEFQQFVIAAGLTAAAAFARHSPWGRTYWRLALGLWVQFAALTLSNTEIWQGSYRGVFVYDFVWIVPFAFYPWAAQASPASLDTPAVCNDVSFTPSRPWMIFGALALVPVIDSALRKTLPVGGSDAVRDVSMAVTLISTLPILMARLAVERAQTRHADGKVRLLAAAVEQAEELIWIASRDGRFEHTNRALRQATGYTPAEFEALRLDDLVPRESSEQGRSVADAVRMGEAWRGTILRRRKDGATFWSSATVAPLTDDRDRVNSVLGVERDITDDLRLREQLIHTERLSAAGQLVSGVAHELNNPLQSILGFTELLLNSERRRAVRRDLERVHAEAERAGKIVGNLLAFVRKSSAERTEADFNDLVRGAVAIRAYELKSRHIDVVERYAPGLDRVSVNREEIRQILLNLILNAEHAMQRPGGGGRLELVTGASGHDVFVEVRDDGPGVPADVAGQIFEPFFTTKEVGEGTGLGLPISLGIAEAHRGALVLVPTTSGAAFRLTLPTARQWQQDDAASSGRRAAEGGHRRALVVDADVSVCDGLRSVLGSRGFESDGADDVNVAARLLDTNRYDLILCDIGMPRMGGVLLYERVRLDYPHLLRGFAFIAGDTFADVPRLIEPAQVPMLSKAPAAAELDDLLHRLEPAR